MGKVGTHVNPLPPGPTPADLGNMRQVQLSKPPPPPPPEPPPLALSEQEHIEFKKHDLNQRVQEMLLRLPHDSFTSDAYKLKKSEVVQWNRSEKKDLDLGDIVRWTVLLPPDLFLSGDGSTEEEASLDLEKKLQEKVLCPLRSESPILPSRAEAAVRRLAETLPEELSAGNWPHQKVFEYWLLRVAVLNLLRGCQRGYPKQLVSVQIEFGNREGGVQQHTEESFGVLLRLEKEPSLHGLQLVFKLCTADEHSYAAQVLQGTATFLPQPRIEVQGLEEVIQEHTRRWLPSGLDKLNLGFEEVLGDAVEDEERDGTPKEEPAVDLQLVRLWEPKSGGLEIDEGMMQGAFPVPGRPVKVSLEFDGLQMDLEGSVSPRESAAAETEEVEEMDDEEDLQLECMLKDMSKYVVRQLVHDWLIVQRRWAAAALKELGASCLGLLASTWSLFSCAEHQVAAELTAERLEKIPGEGAKAAAAWAMTTKGEHFRSAVLAAWGNEKVPAGLAHVMFGGLEVYLGRTCSYSEFVEIKGELYVCYENEDEREWLVYSRDGGKMTERSADPSCGTTPRPIVFDDKQGAFMSMKRTIPDDEPQAVPNKVKRWLRGKTTVSLVTLKHFAGETPPYVVLREKEEERGTALYVRYRDDELGWKKYTRGEGGGEIGWETSFKKSEKDGRLYPQEPKEVRYSEKLKTILPPLAEEFWDPQAEDNGRPLPPKIVEFFKYRHLASLVVPKPNTDGKDIGWCRVRRIGFGAYLEPPVDPKNLSKFVGELAFSEARKTWILLGLSDSARRILKSDELHNREWAVLQDGDLEAAAALHFADGVPSRPSTAGARPVWVDGMPGSGAAQLQQRGQQLLLKEPRFVAEEYQRQWRLSPWIAPMAHVRATLPKEFDLSALEQELMYKFQNPLLALEAMTHSSYLSASTPSMRRLAQVGVHLVRYTVTDLLLEANGLHLPDTIEIQNPQTPGNLVPNTQEPIKAPKEWLDGPEHRQSSIKMGLEDIKDKLDAICCNASLARAAVALQLHHRLMHSAKGSDLERVLRDFEKSDVTMDWLDFINEDAPRCLGDAFCAALAAVLLDGTWPVAYRHIRPLVENKLLKPMSPEGGCFKAPISYLRQEEPKAAVEFFTASREGTWSASVEAARPVHAEPTLLKPKDQLKDEKDRKIIAARVWKPEGNCDDLYAARVVTVTQPARRPATGSCPHTAAQRAVLQFLGREGCGGDEGQAFKKREPPEEAELDQPRLDGYFCHICQLGCNSEEQWRDHRNGQKHRKRAALGNMANPPPRDVQAQPKAASKPETTQESSSSSAPGPGGPTTLKLSTAVQTPSQTSTTQTGPPPQEFPMFNHPGGYPGGFPVPPPWMIPMMMQQYQQQQRQQLQQQWGGQRQAPAPPQSHPRRRGGPGGNHQPPQPGRGNRRSNWGEPIYQ